MKNLFISKAGYLIFLFNIDHKISIKSINLFQIYV